MVILDVDDFEAEKKRVEDENISIVWNADEKKKIYMLEQFIFIPKRLVALFYP